MAEERIHDVLGASFPFYGYRGEELGLLSYPRDQEKHSWLVDPHDGTSAAIAGFRGGAVSIALLRDGVPILGVVYAYAAPDDAGDLFSWAEGSGPVRRNGVITSRTWSDEPSNENTVLVSHEADRNPRANAKLVEPMRYRAVAGLAYRLALVAAGEGDVAVSLNAPVGWDFAAGHAVLRGAEGDLYDEDGSSIKYDVTGSARCGTMCFGGPRSLVNPLIGKGWGNVLATPRDNAGAEVLCRLHPGQTLQNSGLLARAQGCLLGQFAGDALGSLVEFQDPISIRNKYPDGPRKMADGGTWETIAGQPTDDSELALSLARCILNKGSYDAEKAARAYAHWFQSKPFDIGNATKRALSSAARHLTSGKPVAAASSAAADPRTEANGALMRCSPLGIFGTALKLETIAELARRDAALTHPNIVCRDASAVFAIAISIAIRQGCGGSATLYRTIGAAEKLDICEEVRKCLENAQSEPPRDYMSQQGWVLVALQNGLYQMHRAASLEEGIVNTVRQGGDTDTNAAIAGALLGAVWGRHSVPAQWMSSILSCRPLDDSPRVKRPRPSFYWPVDALCIAERLVLAGMQVAKKTELPVSEDVRSEYVGGDEMLVLLTFEEALGLLRLASTGEERWKDSYTEFPQDFVRRSGVSGLAKLSSALDSVQRSYRRRVSSGEIEGTRIGDIPEYLPEHPNDLDRVLPLGGRIYLLCGLEEGCGLMEFAKSGSLEGTLQWAEGVSDNIQNNAGHRAIGRIYQSVTEAMQRHRQKTGMPGFVWGAAEDSLKFLMRDKDDKNA